MSVKLSSLRRFELIILLIASAVFLACVISPPALMDDVDSVQASIAHTMLQTGDWVTPHLDGVKYLEKPPLKYWLIAIFFKLFGVHDYVARLPLAIIDVLLCWLTFASALGPLVNVLVSTPGLSYPLASACFSSPEF